MTLSVFIDGAAGTTGLEIRDRLTGRGEFDLVVLGENDRKDARARREALNDCDIAILCLPDDAAREAVALIDERSATRVIDASSAHRISEGWTYGFPELVGRETIARATRISNPGCYPSGFLALVAPLVRTGVLPADWPYTCNAVSGYSGGGKALIERFEKDGDIGFRAYGLDLAHKHRPEMKCHAGLTHGVIFAPAVVNAYRGMIVEVPLHLGAIDADLSPDRLRHALTEFYDGSSIVNVKPDGDIGELVIGANDPPSDGLDLYVFGNAEGYHARLVAKLDNLGKGASGAAVQNLNLLADLPEETGLVL